MKKTKFKTLIVVFAITMLCTGTVTALAGGKYGKLGNHSVGAETYANSTTYVGMARTVSSSYDVYASLKAYYSYYNSITGEADMLIESDGGYYGAEVTFTLPVGFDRSTVVSAEHRASYDTQVWECMTAAYFE